MKMTPIWFLPFVSQHLSPRCSWAPVKSFQSHVLHSWLSAVFDRIRSGAIWRPLLRTIQCTLCLLLCSSYGHGCGTPMDTCSDSTCAQHRSVEKSVSPRDCLWAMEVRSLWIDAPETQGHLRVLWAEDPVTPQTTQCFILAVMLLSLLPSLVSAPCAHISDFTTPCKPISLVLLWRNQGEDTGHVEQGEDKISPGCSSWSPIQCSGKDTPK